MQYEATVPVILDRCHQARVLNALEPEWEARFEPKSYGFRPGRGCQDAIEAIHMTAKGKSARRVWALDADLASAFDLIAHDHIQTMIGAFPARGMIRAWLKAGVVEQGRLHRTEDGVPQGGVVSPLLLNVALHGMETAAGVRYYQTGNSAGKAVMGSPVLIRYADDFVALCHTRQEALEIKARLAKWLAPRGLAFNEDKTRVVSLADGFDFLGFNVRRYRGKLLIKPSKAAIRRIRARLRSELGALRGHSAKAVIRRLNPIIRGWANYYRTHVTAEIFDKLDQYLWRLTYKWARFSHANKSASWVIARYFGKFNKARQDRWVFGDRQDGSYIRSSGSSRAPAAGSIGAGRRSPGAPDAAGRSCAASSASAPAPSAAPSMFATATAASAPLPATAHHRSARRLSSSRLTREISTISASPWRVASTCSEVIAASAWGTYTVRLRPSPYTVRYA